MSCNVNMIEDDAGDLIDIEYACSAWCANALGFPAPSAWPGGMETDYAVSCGNCGSHMWDGLEDDAALPQEPVTP